jgi:hypothetical protein
MNVNGPGDLTPSANQFEPFFLSGGSPAFMQYEEGHIRRKLSEELVKGLTPEMSVWRRGPENDPLSIEYTSSPVGMSREDLTKITSALRDALAVARGV